MNKNYLTALITVLIWSTLAPVVKIMVSDMPSFQFLSITSLLAAAFLLVLNIAKGNLKEMRTYKAKDYATIAGLGFLGFFAYNAFYFFGIFMLTSQIACILNYLWPMMIVVFSCIILKEKMTFVKAFSVICSFTGVVILSLGGSAGASGNSITGMILCVLAALSYGLFSVLNKKVAYNQYVAMMIFWLVSGVFGLAFGLATETWVPVTGHHYFGILWIGFVDNAIAYLLWAIVLNNAPNTATIANFAYLTPFLSLILSAVLIGEQITASALIALIFIVGGILFQSIYESKHKTIQN